MKSIDQTFTEGELRSLSSITRQKIEVEAVLRKLSKYRSSHEARLEITNASPKKKDR